MKQGFTAAMLLSALLGLGLGAPSHAATDAKKTQSATKKTSDKAASTTKQSSAKTQKASAKSSQKQAAHVAQKPASEPVAKKSVRKVSMADVDPRRLMLYSASALVIDQETGQPLLEKQSDTVVPIASISKLMTAMVVLDAKLDMNEVIAIGDDDVDELKGTRSRLPVGTTMTRGSVRGFS